MTRCLLVAFLVAALTAPAYALGGKAHVTIENKTAYGAWVTVYRYAFRDVIAGSYCVRSSERNTRFFKDAYKVQVEVEKSKAGCGAGRAWKCAKDIQFPEAFPPNSAPAFWRLTVEGSPGHFHCD